MLNVVQSSGFHVIDLSTCLIRILLISDINECLQPNKCKGICHNTKENFSCTECPRKTEYDPLKMQCTKSQQPLLLGKTIIVTVFHKQDRTET